jgi:hypothetical protein
MTFLIFIETFLAAIMNGLAKLASGAQIHPWDASNLETCRFGAVNAWLEATLVGLPVVMIFAMDKKLHLFVR